MPSPDGGTLTTSSSILEIDAADVLRLIMQFLREHGLSKSLRVLQEESNVGLNAVDDVASFTADVVSGRWDLVLNATAHLRLPPHVLAALYEHVVKELLEARELDAARALLRGTLPLQLLKAEEPARYGRLDAWAAAAAGGTRASNAAFDPGEAYGSDGRAGRRAALARMLGDHLVSAPPSRLITLLGAALRDGGGGAVPGGAQAPPRHGHFDIFLGRVPATAPCDLMDRPATVAAGVLRPGSAPGAVAWSPDGSNLIVGAADGIIEVYDGNSAGSGVAPVLRLDLPYQAADEFMLHEEAITCLAVSGDGDLLASGSRDGKVKVWRIASGECVRRFAAPGGAGHAGGGVSALAFSLDGATLATGGFDGSVRLYGLRSGAAIRDFRGHSSYVNGIAWGAASDQATDALRATGDADVSGASRLGAATSGDDRAQQLWSASSDGSARLWDVKTALCVAVLRPPQPRGASATDVSIVAALPMPPPQQQQRSSGVLVPPRDSVVTIEPLDTAIVVPRSSCAYVMAAASGVVRRTFTLGTKARDAGAAPSASAVSKTAGDPHQFASEAATMTAATLSPRGRFLYVGMEDGRVAVFDVVTASLEGQTTPAAPIEPGSALAGRQQQSVRRGEVFGLAHHPLRNLVASWGGDGTVCLWRAPSSTIAL